MTSDQKPLHPLLVIVFALLLPDIATLIIYPLFEALIKGTYALFGITDVTQLTIFATQTNVEIWGQKITVQPIFEMIISVARLPLIIWAVLKLMQWRGMNSHDVLGLRRIKRSEFWLTLKLFAGFLLLDTIYVALIDIEIPNLFVDYVYAAPLLLGFIAIVIVPAIGEEFIFRGFLYGHLVQTRLGVVGTIILSSFLWTILHGQYLVPILLSVFVMGLLFGYIRYRTNSLYPVMFLHGLNNLIYFFVYLP